MTAFRNNHNSCAFEFTGTLCHWWNNLFWLIVSLSDHSALKSGILVVASNMTYMQMVLQVNMGVLPDFGNCDGWGLISVKKWQCQKNCIQIDLKTDNREFWLKMTLKCDILIADQVWILMLVVGHPNILVSNSFLVISSYPLNSYNLEPNSILCSTGINSKSQEEANGVKHLHVVLIISWLLFYRSKGCSIFTLSYVSCL